MALIGRVRVYKIDKDDPPDPAKQDDMPDPEFDVRLYGMNHEINVPIKPEDIAPVVCFMLSDMTHWFRGANLMLDGGMSSHIYQNMHKF